MRLADCTEFAERRVNELSGGERARVMLARALAVETPVLFCDEPIASLDPYHQLHILAMLRRHAESGVIVICVLHDLTWAARFCHRLLLLNNGQLVADGESAQVLTAKHLASVYQIRAISGMSGEDSYLLPWECLDINPAK
jgi:iron complex transport system ATP-binding protein